MDIFGRYLWSWIGSIKAKALETSSLSSSDRMLLLSRADLWFPLDRWKLLSDFLDSSSIGSRGNLAPFSSVSLVYFQSGCSERIGSSSEVFLNSEP